MRFSRTLAAAALSLAFLAAPLLATAADDDDAGASRDGRHPNVLVTITLGKVEEGERKPLRSYHLLAPGSGSPARLNTANRIPIPASMTMGPGGDDNHLVPVTSFSYQNVGFQANVRATVLGGDLVKIHADIEDAALYNPADIDRKPGSMGAPVVTSFSQSIDALVHERVPLVTTLIDDPKGQSMYIQIVAEIQR